MNRAPKLSSLAAAALAAWLAAPAVLAAGSNPPEPSPARRPASPDVLSPEEKARLDRERAEDHYRKGYELVEAAKREEAAGDTAAPKKKYAKALKHFQSATGLDARYHEAWNMLGYCARKTGDLPRAFEAYARCLALAPDYEEAHEYLGEAYVMSGDLEKAKEQLAWLRARNSDEAEELAEKIEAAEKR